MPGVAHLVVSVSRLFTQGVKHLVGVSLKVVVFYAWCNRSCRCQLQGFSVTPGVTDLVMSASSLLLFSTPGVTHLVVSASTFFSNARCNT